jgi:hypothetical protein
MWTEEELGRLGAFVEKIGLLLVDVLERVDGLDDALEVRRVGRDSANSDSAVANSLLCAKVVEEGLVMRRPACFVRAELGLYGTKVSLERVGAGLASCSCWRFFMALVVFLPALECVGATLLVGLLTYSPLGAAEPDDRLEEGPTAEPVVVEPIAME